MSLTSYRAAPPRAKPRWIPTGKRKACGLELGWRGSVCLQSTDLCGPGGDLLSRVLRRSTIGAEAFDGRVRDGIGSDRYAESHQAGEGRKKKQTGTLTIARHTSHQTKKIQTLLIVLMRKDGHRLMRAIKPIELLVPVSCTHCCASTPGLSTWSSSTALKGELVLRWVSRLDAFSGYPVHT